MGHTDFFVQNLMLNKFLLECFFLKALKTNNFRDIRSLNTKIYICDVIQQKVHKVGKWNFASEAFKDNEVKMIKTTFLRKIVRRDI